MFHPGHKRLPPPPEERAWGAGVRGVTRRAIVLPLAAVALLSSACHADDPVDYPRQVKPILAARCYACHGALGQKNGLRLDTATLLKRGGDSGPAIAPGKSGESLLMQHVTAAGGATRMPPESEGEGLKPDQIATLRRWIDQGAAAPADEKPEKDPRDHWAFRRPVRPAVPEARLLGEAGLLWVRNPIDAFIAAEHQRHGLVPQPPADKRLLLRRVYLDLIGLPPSRAETEIFVADRSPDAYERVVDRLLESPRYGERWGRHWMDIWRYSDWWGLGAEVRNSQKHIWHWRDWIVESVNADKPYDEMVRQMLAADELYPTDLEKLRATGFLARSYFKFNRNTWMEEVVEHTSKAFLGLTANCAKCHNHKYDPIKQEDYYRLRAFFEPYQVRTDQLPGETDYEQGGLPRAFDCNLDTPTYLFTRGDERRPVKDKTLAPGLPAILTWEPLRIESVNLPPEAHQPGLRPFVLEDQLRLAERQIAAAHQAVAAARKQLAEAESTSTPAAPSSRGATAAPGAKTTPAADAKSKPLFADDFTAAKPEAWEQRSGDWAYEGGRLRQRQDGDNRAALRWKKTPTGDFQARFKFTPTAGQMWKSVGLSFDVAGENEILVYLSAYAGGSKLQIAYKQGAGYAYPTDGVQSREVKLGEPQDMVVRVRGQLLNVSLGGQHALAYQLPIPRRSGHIELITYDAKATFERFEIGELPKDFVLVETGASASAKPQPMTVEQARLAVKAAESSLAAAEMQPRSLEARAAADRARHVAASLRDANASLGETRPRDGAQPPAADAKALAAVAAKAEKQLALLQAEGSLAQAEFERSRAATAQQAAAEGKVNAARQGVAAARKALESPGESYTPLRGALKTLESNLESEASRNKPFPTTSTGRRTALARWLTDVRNPLPARVAANHVWARHFGRPLVATVFDFGRKGSEPTHPALLDYLAVELQQNGWSLKHLHRLMVTSNVYRMTSSSAGAAASAIDPENRWYWRMNSLRMDAQTVRDSLLALAGEMDGRLGGASLDPVQMEDSRRRSLYFVHSHNDQHKFLSLFDDANVLECYRRSESIVPQQALAMSNSQFASDMAERIAARLQREYAQASDAEFIRGAFAAILGSLPNADELAACEESLARLQSLPGQDAGAKSSRARARLVHALINHNDFVTIR